MAKGGGTDPHNFEIAIISSDRDFYNRLKILENLGISRNAIIDGRIFFRTIFDDFTKFLNEKIAYSFLQNRYFNDYISPSTGTTIVSEYPRIFRTLDNALEIALDKKGYINRAIIDGSGLISVGKFSSVSFDETFRLNTNVPHDYKRISSYGPESLGWRAPRDFYKPVRQCKILIGNDVWIGRNCILKATNPDKPLIIGDGAVIASDSVVVKSISPYAIVGGNPAQVIKYRFSEKIIESLLRIKWWDWDIDKIHDNFQYFNRVEEFVEMHDVSW